MLSRVGYGLETGDGTAARVSRRTERVNRGATTLVTDMTGDTSCDQAGADAVTRTWQGAAENPVPALWLSLNAGPWLSLEVVPPAADRVSGHPE